jgi:hypothetical protein
MVECDQIYPFPWEQRLLCSGDGQVGSGEGNFWPDTPVPLNEMQNQVLLLQMRDGRKFKISDFRPGSGSVHKPRYDFKIVEQLSQT